MKKLLMYVIAMGAVAGCSSYDYYKGDVRYVQDGDDCVYYSNEYARNYSDRIRGIDGSDRIVYKNTKCEALFARDNAGRTPRDNRMVVAPAAVEIAPACTKCGGECAAKARTFFAFTGK